MGLTLGLLADSQHASVVALLCEAHRHHLGPAAETPAQLEDQVHAHLRLLTGPDASHRLLVAADAGGRVVGLAAFALVFSLIEPAPERRRQCQLKELYVLAAARGQGVGRALMAWLAQHALAHGCHRVDWNVQAGNLRGIAFYEDLGAVVVSDRLSLRLQAPALRQLAAVAAGQG